MIESPPILETPPAIIEKAKLIDRAIFPFPVVTARAATGGGGGGSGSNGLWIFLFNFRGA